MIPGAAVATRNDIGTLDAPFTVTTRVAGPGEISYGNWALICVGLTRNRGASMPFTSAETPPSVVGSGVEDAPIVVDARFVPRIEIIDPGATGD
jgi:hypothetical protein